MWTRTYISQNPFSASRQRKSLTSSRTQRQHQQQHQSKRMPRSIASVVLWVVIILSTVLILLGTTVIGKKRSRSSRRERQGVTTDSYLDSRPSSQVSLFHNKGSNEYLSKQEEDDRAVRFPSVQERVRIYMSNWYVPPCPENVGGTVQFNFQLQNDLGSSLSGQKLYIQEVASRSIRKVRLFEMTGTVETDSSKLFYLHSKALQQCKHESCKDVINQIQPYARKGRHTRSLTATTKIPILLDLGDKEVTMAYQPKEATDGIGPNVPYIKKYRLAYTKEEIDHMTTYHCFRGLRDQILPAILQPIIWKLKVSRHYGMLQNVTAFDIPYHQKKDMALFRGRLSGVHKEGLTVQEGDFAKKGLTDSDRCMMIPRCRLVLRNAGSSRIDARLVGPTKGLPKKLVAYNTTSSIESEIFSSERMSLQEMLKYKAIIMMEGNDVPSGLKWALYSNSVVMMEPITVTSWAMEERLRPWIHYVPINQDGSNVEEQFKWILKNPKAAHRIARNGALWIKDLVFHPQAGKDEEIIYHDMMKRYQLHFTSNPHLF